MGNALNGRPARLTRLVGATAMACVLAAALLPADSTRAQMLGTSAAIPHDKQMLLEADNLIFDRDKNTVTAVGNVQIEYGGNHLVARRVVYNRTTKRVLATGNVEVVDSKKNHIFADEMDVTDDFRDGFVNALRVETPDKTYMGADSAERAGGVVTIFNRGVYTACAPCEDKPDKPPVWRIKAKTVVWNGQSKTMRFLHSRFEFFGFPIAYFPQLEIPDPTVKRKTGLLMPGFSYNDKMGFGYTQPIYVALTPTYDLTLKPTYYSLQGFMGEAEFRQRFNNGSYSITVAGIDQNDPLALTNKGFDTVDSGPAGDRTRWRGMIGTKGNFTINPRWTFGWNILAQSDKDFSRIYAIQDFNNYVQRNEVYLTGLNDRNYFDARIMKFNVQEQALASNPGSVDETQPWVLPSIDYSYIPNEPVAGGELEFDANVQSLYRYRLDENAAIPLVRGIDGSDGRFTAQVKWRRQFITDIGIVITPSLGLRGDAIYANYAPDTFTEISNMAGALGVGTDFRSQYYRYMATAGLEVAWPILFSTPGASHVIEPVAQIFARPNEQYIGGLGIPNEDAQSMVFDATNLFDEDKFSGYDRVEGGTRANVGFRYSGSFDSGWSANGIFGQSYQLAGQNSFAAPDLVNAGAFSGLETARSDYVALLGFSSPNGVSFSTAGRFDNDTFAARRVEARAGYTASDFSVAARYAYIEAQPLYGFTEDRQQITLSASARVGQYWHLFGSSTYDMHYNETVADAVGISYLDDCFGYSLAVGQSYNVLTNERRTDIGFNLSFRTIGDFGSDTRKMFTQ
ncbi:MAG: Organic solvent tolerance protein [Rhizobiales bacterium 65-79]|jgi:LPS-assembly protein|nr:LPS-assembly protein LptD [Hyphomicrobiales bacterium]OJU05208.1 MAG: Organic solvent tolerance protein [Rhizobiales bacterium 65-79]